MLATLIGMMFVSMFPARSECGRLLREAVDRVHEEGLDRADAIFASLLAECEGSQGLARELAGIRFAQRRWKEAAALARTAVLEDPTDQYSFDLLGTTLLLQGEVIEAVRAWNHIGKPVISAVHVRVDTGRDVGVEAADDVTAQLSARDFDIEPFRMLTSGRFQRARRRLGEIAAERDARVVGFELRPDLDGTMSLEARVAQRALVPRDALNWVSRGLAAAIDREVAIGVRSPIVPGERCSATWRWWSNRARLAANCELPGIALVPGYKGFWQIEGSWETETYSLPAASSPAMQREHWTHAAMTSSDWLTGVWRYSFGIGFDSWAATPDVRAFSLSAAIERRSFDDRRSVALSLSQWVPVTGNVPFRSVAARFAVRSTRASRAWQYMADFGVSSVSRQAPLSLWPTAAEGSAPPLRAHPLLDRGIVSLNRSTMLFGRELLRGSVEVRHWSDRLLMLPIGVAGFLDFAQAGRPLLPGSHGWEADMGSGIRVRLPSSERLLRVDFGYGLRDGGKAVTFGSMF